jgi:hypothetical protein
VGKVINPEELTESGERACVRLNELYGSNLPSAQLITGIGTVVERHVGAVLARLIYLSDVKSTQIGSALVDEISESMNATWKNRKKWLSSGFGISYSGTTSGQNFDTLVELRNSIVHGDGALSDLQEKKSVDKLIALRREFKEGLSTKFFGRAEFSDDSSDRAMMIARQFMLEFDRAVVSLYPDARRF